MAEMTMAPIAPEGQEVWVPAPRFPDYEVSSFGRIRRLTDKGNRRAGLMLRSKTKHVGYWRVGLRRDNRHCNVLVHRLVCEAFHGPAPSPKHQAAHNDGDRGNCHFANLRWATPSENQKDRIGHGTDYRGGSHPRTPLSDRDAVTIRYSLKANRELANEYGVKIYTIQRIKAGINWTHLWSGPVTDEERATAPLASLLSAPS